MPTPSSLRPPVFGRVPGVWTDVGTLEDGDEAMAGAGTGGGAAGGGAAPPPPGGKPWDYVRGVTMETAQGMRSLQVGVGRACESV